MQKWHFLFSFLLLLSFQLVAQSAEKECTVDTCLHDQWLIKISRFETQFPDSAIDEYKLAIRFADSIHYKRGEINSRYSFAGMYSTLTMFESANRYLEETLELAKKYNMGRACGAVYLRYGNNARKIGRYEAALNYFNLADKEFKKVGYIKGQTAVLVNMAIIYKVQDQFDLALRFYRKAHNSVDNKDTVAYFNAMINLASVKASMIEPDSVHYFFNRAKQLLGAKKIDNFKRVQFYSSAALYYHNEADSLRHYISLIEQYIPPKNVFLHASLAVHKGKLHFIEGNYDNSILALQEAILLADSVNSWEHKKTALLLMHKNYENKGDFELALSTYKELEYIQDSLAAEETIYKLKAFEKQFEIEKQERELAQSLFETEQEKALRLEAEKSTSTLKWVACILVLIALVIGLFYSRLKRQKNVIEDTLGEKEVLLGEVHHRVKNNLQLISSILDMQMRSIEDKEAIQALMESQNKVNAVAIIHQKLYKSANFSAINSKDYLEDLLHTVISTLRPKNFNLQEDIQLTPIDLSLNKSIPLGLILTELMNNAFKHGFHEVNSAAISIVFKETKHSYILQVTNTGNLKESSKNRGFGLKMVQSLARQLKGDFSIKQHDVMTVAELTFPN